MLLSSRYIKLTMSSSRFSARGRNQWRRGFLRESREVDGFVSGEDHVGEVRAANCVHRHGIPQQKFRPSAPPFRTGPPPKSADHRNWIFAASQPPAGRERFKVLSYNILADYLALDHHSSLYFHIPDHILAWEWRKRRLFIEFGLWSPDIMCLQEVDQFCDLEGELAIRGYSGIWKMRTGNAVDGCAIFWRTNRFQLRHEEHIEFSKLGLRDNVAQICVLESKMRFAENAALALSNNPSSGANQVVVCNIHVLYNPKRGEIKLGQVRILLDRAFAISRTWNDAPVIVCGDFNSIPMSPLYKYITTQTLNLSGLARDQISGQYSATLHRRPNSRYSSDRPQSPSHYASERTFGKSDCKTRLENQDNMESSSPMEESAVTLNQDVEQKADGQMWSGAATLKLGEAEIVTRQEGEASLAHSELANMPNRTSELLSQQSIICANVNAVEIREEPRKNILVEPFSEDHKVSRGSGDLSDINFHSFQTDISNTPSFHSNKDDLFSMDSSIKSYDTSSEEKPCTSYASLQVQMAENTEKSAIGSSVTEMAGSHITCENSSKDNGLDRYNFDGSHVRDRMNVVSCIEDGKIMDNMNPVAADKIIEEIPTLCGNLTRDATLNETSQRPEEFGLEENADSNFFKELLGVEDCNHSMKDVNAPNVELREDSSCPITNVDFNVERRFYDPYCWSPMELEISSGNAKCTVVEHHLKLRSVYTDVEDYTGTKESNREPQVTSYNQQFMGTVDYIWCSEDLHTVKVLDTIPKNVLQRTPGFPTRKWGSDHIALACELAFSNGSQNK